MGNVLHSLFDRNVIKYGINLPFKLLYNLYPTHYRLQALQKQDEDGRTVLYYAKQNEELKEIENFILSELEKVQQTEQTNVDNS